MTPTETEKLDISGLIVFLENFAVIAQNLAVPDRTVKFAQAATTISDQAKEIERLTEENANLNRALAGEEERSQIMLGRAEKAEELRATDNKTWIMRTEVAEQRTTQAESAATELRTKLEQADAVISDGRTSSGPPEMANATDYWRWFKEARARHASRRPSTGEGT